MALLSFATGYVCLLLTLGVYTNDLVVHLIPHTHDDPGWLNTATEYYYGAKNDVQPGGVQYILDSAVVALRQNPQRKFTYAEMFFFTIWWDQQNEETKNIVRKLVANRQIEFINGGWVLNDEATVHYEDTITQMSRGHQFLLEEFGYRPSIGWQIDGFGHSAAHASLIARMGFNAVFWVRIDYQEYDKRLNESALEFVWQPSYSLGSTTDIFASTFWHGLACYPPGFAFTRIDPPIQDDPSLFGYNVKERANLFVQDMLVRAPAFRTNNIYVAFGCDFSFQNANIDFKNLDKLMKEINSNSSYGLSLKWSTPSEYLQAIHSKNITWTSTNYDFFPYADRNHSYWTGFFTSRPAFKGYVRTRSNLLYATEKLFTAAGLTGDNSALLAQIDELTQAVSLGQHHDAITGTNKFRVSQDYETRLHRATVICQSAYSTILGRLISNDSSTGPSFTFCEYLNMSDCPILNSLEEGKIISLIVYNQVAWSRQEAIRLPIPKTVEITVSTSNSTLPVVRLPNEDATNLTSIVFIAQLPPMGFETFFLQPTSKSKSNTFAKLDIPEDNYTIENEYYQLNFSSDNLLSGIYNKDLRKSLKIHQNFYWYNSSTGNADSPQPSGTYIFRPNRTTPFIFNPQPQIYIQRTSLVQQVTQVFNSWLQQTIRLYSGIRAIEVETTVGPIDITDGMGKEIITRFSTEMKTNKTFYTDQSGLEMQARILNFRPTWNASIDEPVAGNYYPITTATFIRDVKLGLQFSVVVDRSCGAASLHDGELEVMMHRRLTADDLRGLKEPLDDSSIIRTRQFILLESIEEAIKYQRIFAEMLNRQPIVTFSPIHSIQSYQYQTSFTALKASLPLNVQLTTFKTVQKNSLIIRFHHLFAVDEHDTLAKPVSLDIAQIFNRFILNNITELSLSANQELSQMERYTWNVDNRPDCQSWKEYQQRPHQQTSYWITLKPMDIKTFSAQVLPIEKRPILPHLKSHVKFKLTY